jgi:diaminopimelate epimerase
MIERIDFVKLSGSGNDFICIDNRDGRFDELISSGRAGHSDIGARFFEPDGSEAELCGNGTACFIFWAVTNGWLPEDEEVKSLTTAGVVRGQKLPGRYVRVCIPTPEDMQTDLELCTGGNCWKLDYLVTGVPHAIVYVEDVNEVDVARAGPPIRHHQRFQPRGANVNFVQVLGEGSIAVRTFEFGVEGETLACGTGSAAAAILTALRFGWPKDYLAGKKPVRIAARSGDILKVYFTVEKNGSVMDVCLETIVRCVFSGKIHADLAAEALGSPAGRGKACPA